MGSETFLGFMLQVRDEDGDAVGTFDNVFANETRIQFLDCFNTDVSDHP